MSSWFQCDCGNSIHKNLFAGAGVSFLVHEDLLDVDIKSLSAEELRLQVTDCPKVLRCAKCLRLYILDADDECLFAYKPDEG